MKPEVRKFIESLQPEFEYIYIESNGYVTLPYLGRILVDDSMTNSTLIRLIADSTQEQGRIWGKQEMANDLKKLLQIPNDDD